MKNLLSKLFITLIFTTIIFGCAKETQTQIIKQNVEPVYGKFYTRVTISPALQSGSSSSGSNILELNVDNYTKQWYSNSVTSAISEMTSDEFIVTKKQNVLVSVKLTNYYDKVCRNVKLECYLDGNLIQTSDLSMGVKATSPTVYCKDNVLFQKNVIIE